MNKKLENVVIVYILLNMGGVIEHRFETAERLNDYQVYEIMAKLEPDFLTCIEDEDQYYYPSLEVNKDRCYGVSIRRFNDLKNK